VSDDDQSLVTFLASREAPCPVCGYNLRGLARAACPECGAALRLQVGSENLALGPWFLAAVSFALGLGFDGVIGLLLAIGLIANPPPSPGVLTEAIWIVSGFVGGAGMCAGGIALLLKRRRAWLMMARRRQWTWAWAIFAGVGAAHAIYGLIVFIKIS
jgi:hypothetical protein